MMRFRSFVGRRVRIPLLFAGVALPLVGASAQGAASRADTPASGQAATGRTSERPNGAASPAGSNGGISQSEARRQDHELDAIGRQLLDETPKSAAGTTMRTGGGTTP